MTYASKYISQAGRGDFKTLSVNALPDGMRCRTVDVIDGQVYEVVVKPTGVTLSLDAIEAIKKGNEVRCASCGALLTDEEIIENIGHCNYCYLAVTKEANEEQKHPDNKGN